MRPTATVASSRIALVAMLLAMLAAVGCRPDLVVRLATRVYHDGSLDRIVHVTGRTAEGERPTEPRWLADDAGLRLADPEAWADVTTTPGGLVARGFFRSTDELPALFTFETEHAERPGRTRTLVDIDDRVVIERWIYSERHGDPYNASDSAGALDALVELAVEALRSELTAHFGPTLDTAPAEELFRTEGRSLAAALLVVNRSVPGRDRANERVERWSRVVSQYGAPAVEVDDPEDYWDAQVRALFAWARDRVAASLTTESRTIAPEELSFWPVGDETESRAMEIVERVWGDEDALWEEVEPHVAAIAGYFGRRNVPRFRFEIRARLPGVLLRTNGTPDGDSVVWLMREHDLTFGEVNLRAESVEPIDEPLRRLGARRTLSRAELLQLADLLWKRDPDGVLTGLLEAAVDAGDLGMLRDEDEVPEDWVQAARELADLLDPNVERPVVEGMD